MLTGKGQIAPKSRQRGRKKWHDAESNVPSMGCSVCPEYKTCGGLFVAQPLFWCLDYCCGNARDCDVVCRNHQSFVDRVREIAGFDLSNVARSKSCVAPNLPTVLPMYFHGSGRNSPSRAISVVLPFARMFNQKTGKPKFNSRSELCEHFKILPDASIVLSGTDVDRPIENWWGLGRDKRAAVIRSLKDIGIDLITSPNFSLFTDQPRWDDLHSLKRIAITHGEFLRGGLQAALHINGRTEKDFERWTEYLAGRPEIEFVAYEFTTGPGWIGRRELHVDWLQKLSRGVRRPLHLIVRGGVETLPSLEQAFATVTFIDTAAFMRTIKRRRAVLTESGRLSWRASPTGPNEPLDNLLRVCPETLGRIAEFSEHKTN